MAYEPHTWVADELITHDKLNHMETGIANAGSGGSSGGVGQSMAGQDVYPSAGATYPTTADDGAEIFNDYRERTFSGSIANAGNVASGAYSHAEGYATTASGGYSHAEGGESLASGRESHAEGTRGYATGNASHAEGYMTKASGEASHSEGYKTTAQKNYSHSEGNMSIADGVSSHSEGTNTHSSGSCSHAEGIATIASSINSHAEGNNTTASGENAHAEGVMTTASGENSHSCGNNCTASGDESFCGGLNSTASNQCSFAFGDEVTSSGAFQTVFGSHNVNSTSRTDAVIIGKGTRTTEVTTKSNCFRITHTGTFASGAYNSSGADYAELFEWADNNPANEDRRGLFVTLDGERIRIAKPGDKNIIGIVSGNPTVLGDVYDDQWQGMYMTDVFGSPIWEDVEVPDRIEERPDPENPGKTIIEVVIPAHTEHRQKLNPNYDNTQKYKARTERPEWAPVGLIGKLVAVDDGTCEPGGYCTVGYDDGVATSSVEETRYYVMSRIDNTHIRVFIKAH